MDKRVKTYADPRDYLMDALNAQAPLDKLKVQIAIALLKVEAPAKKRVRVSKKEEIAEAAHAANAGKFATPDAPKTNGHVKKFAI